MTFEKAVKEVDRLLVHCDRLRGKQDKIDEKINELKKQKKIVNDQWNAYGPSVTAARNIISDTLKKEYAYMIGGYYTMKLDGPFHFKIVDIKYGWNEKSLNHRDMLELVTYTAVLDKDDLDLVIAEERVFNVLAEDILPSSEEAFLDFISGAKYIYKQGYTYGYLSWEKTKIEK